MREFQFCNSIDLIETERCVKLPERSTAKSAGYDFFAPERYVIPPFKVGDKPTMVKTCVKVKMPDDEVLLLFNRSSNPSKKKLCLANGVGVIDADYYNNPDNEGEISVQLINFSTETIKLKKGDKIAQAIIRK